MTYHYQTLKILPQNLFPHCHLASMASIQCTLQITHRKRRTLMVKWIPRGILASCMEIPCVGNNGMPYSSPCSISASPACCLTTRHAQANGSRCLPQLLLQRTLKNALQDLYLLYITTNIIIMSLTAGYTEIYCGIRRSHEHIKAVQLLKYVGRF